MLLIMFMCVCLLYFYIMFQKNCSHVTKNNSKLSLQSAKGVSNWITQPAYMYVE